MMPWEVRSATQKSWRGLGSEAKQRDEVIARNARKSSVWVGAILQNSCFESMMKNGEMKEMEDLSGFI